MRRKALLSNRFLKRISYVLCHVAILFSTSSLFAQNDNGLEALKANLLDEGFENVAVLRPSNTLLFVQYENRRYRFEPRALAKVTEITAQAIGREQVQLDILILHQQIPMVMAHISLPAYFDLIEKRIDLEQFSQTCYFTLDFQQTAAQNVLNPSAFKPDLIVIPNFRAQFGDFDNPVQSNINLIPELRMLLAKGLSLQAQLIIPLQNDFYFDEEGKELRPGMITINQLVRLRNNFFVTATAGFFNRHRAGGNIQVKNYFANGRFAIGADVGFTRYYSFTGREASYAESAGYLTAILSAEYRYTPYDLTGRIRIGNFLYNDPGVRADVLRQFGEVKIGFFALANTSGDLNGGFNFSIPLPPRKYTKIKYARLRPAKSFSWEYRAKGFPTSGYLFETGHDIFDLMLEYNPNYMKKRFLIELL